MRTGEGGFEHGGWQYRYVGEEEIVAEWESKTEALLLCRETYEIFAGAWGVLDEDAEGLQGELTGRNNRIPKYVASRTLTEVGWQNTRLLGSDEAAAVEKLHAERGGEIRVWGSTQLIRTLAERDLVDEYRLVVHPTVLGTGRKLFSGGFPLTRLALTETRALLSGVVINTYRRSHAS
ncbi:dihydrofolate reductase family protein [Paenarthrobacter sp. PH39-S1]|nr:dihydrofolate reductase family protein [Paenarthrobacter sp. PH39-S1]